MSRSNSYSNVFGNNNRLPNNGVAGGVGSRPHSRSHSRSHSLSQSRSHSRSNSNSNNLFSIVSGSHSESFHGGNNSTITGSHGGNNVTSNTNMHASSSFSYSNSQDSQQHQLLNTSGIPSLPLPVGGSGSRRPSFNLQHLQQTPTGSSNLGAGSGSPVPPLHNNSASGTNTPTGTVAVGGGPAKNTMYHNMPSILLRADSGTGTPTAPIGTPEPSLNRTASHPPPVSVMGSHSYSFSGSTGIPVGTSHSASEELLDEYADTPPKNVFIAAASRSSDFSGGSSAGRESSTGGASSSTGGSSTANVAAGGTGGGGLGGYNSSFPSAYPPKYREFGGSGSASGTPGHSQHGSGGSVGGVSGGSGNRPPSGTGTTPTQLPSLTASKQLFNTIDDVEGAYIASPRPPLPTSHESEGSHTTGPTAIEALSVISPAPVSTRPPVALSYSMSFSDQKNMEERMTGDTHSTVSGTSNMAVITGGPSGAASASSVVEAVNEALLLQRLQVAYVCNENKVLKELCAPYLEMKLLASMSDLLPTLPATTGTSGSTKREKEMKEKERDQDEVEIERDVMKQIFSLGDSVILPVANDLLNALAQEVSQNTATNAANVANSVPTTATNTQSTATTAPANRDSNDRHNSNNINNSSSNSLPPPGGRPLPQPSYSTGYPGPCAYPYPYSYPPNPYASAAYPQHVEANPNGAQGPGRYPPGHPQGPVQEQGGYPYPFGGYPGFYPMMMIMPVPMYPPHPMMMGAAGYGNPHGDNNQNNHDNVMPPMMPPMMPAMFPPFFPPFYPPVPFHHPMGMGGNGNNGESVDPRSYSSPYGPFGSMMASPPWMAGAPPSHLQQASVGSVDSVAVATGVANTNREPVSNSGNSAQQLPPPHPPLTVNVNTSGSDGSNGRTKSVKAPTGISNPVTILPLTQSNLPTTGGIAANSAPYPNTDMYSISSGDSTPKNQRSPQLSYGDLAVAAAIVEDREYPHRNVGGGGDRGGVNGGIQRCASDRTTSSFGSFGSFGSVHSLPGLAQVTTGPNVTISGAASNLLLSANSHSLSSSHSDSSHNLLSNVNNNSNVNSNHNTHSTSSPNVSHTVSKDSTMAISASSSSTPGVSNTGGSALPGLIPTAAAAANSTGNSATGPSLGIAARMDSFDFPLDGGSGGSSNNGPIGLNNTTKPSSARGLLLLNSQSNSNPNAATLTNTTNNSQFLRRSYSGSFGGGLGSLSTMSSVSTIGPLAYAAASGPIGVGRTVSNVSLDMERIPIQSLRETLLRTNAIGNRSGDCEHDGEEDGGRGEEGQGLLGHDHSHSHSHSHSQQHQYDQHYELPLVEHEELEHHRERLFQRETILQLLSTPLASLVSNIANNGTSDSHLLPGKSMSSLYIHVCVC